MTRSGTIRERRCGDRAPRPRAMRDAGRCDVTGSRRRRRRRISSLLPSSKRVMPSRSSLTSSLDAEAVSDPRKNTASTCPSAASTSSTTSSGTVGPTVGTGVSASGPRFPRPYTRQASPLQEPSFGRCMKSTTVSLPHGGGSRESLSWRGRSAVAKAPTWACRSVEDRYLGMVEAPSSNRHVPPLVLIQSTEWTVLLQTCSAAFWSGLLARHVTRYDSKRFCWMCDKTDLILTASVFGSASPPFYRFILSSFSARTAHGSV